ncbi:MAG: geranylgeranylglycerol-phosphate geranylgeranyltransferase [Candidatus Methanosuratincola petrocarbonis]
MTRAKSVYETAVAILRLIRPTNSLMMGLAVIIGEIAVLGSIPSLFEMALGFSVSFFLTASSMAMNDYVDLEIDRVNQPGRPLPSGAISKASALAISALTGAIGIMSAFPFRESAVFLAVLTFVASALYNLYGKKTGIWGNLVVSYCVAVPFLYGGIVVLGAFNVTSVTFFLLAFLANTGREVTKGIADMEGDRLRGIRTVALVWGEKTAALVSALFYLTAVAITPLPYVFGQLGMSYVLLVVPVDVGFSYSSYRIIKESGRASALRVKTQVRYWMILALMAFLAGGLIR